MQLTGFNQTDSLKLVMKSLAFTFFVTLLAAKVVANPIDTHGEKKAGSCTETISAIYKVSTENQIKDKSQLQTDLHTLQIWRNQNQIAYYFPASKVTELWEQTRNGRLHLMRYFNEHQRGIEYQPNEIKGGQDWSMKRQFISDKLLSEMTLEKTQGHGCLTVQSLSLDKNQQQYKLEWYGELKLVKSFTISNKDSVVRWELQEMQQEENKITDYFLTLASYETTDYTDIGDNESDPFLRKMINLGFVEHGHAGFYDSEGHSMSEGHQH